MTTSNQNQALNLAAANNAAKQNFPAEDLSSSVSTCPARQAEVFVVPVRYALAELPAEHSCVKPACASQSHATALRQLRPGYLYLWHDQGPLNRYAVAADGKLLEQGLDDPHAEIANGALAGLKLKKPTMPGCSTAKGRCPQQLISACPAPRPSAVSACAVSL